ncbi:DMT family transporter [Gaiella sp.]|uniref:DMT family transporter n=1 Tax=Gaiella sp. TaxID=2663207 RepID=UPI003265AD2E
MTGVVDVANAKRRTRNGRIAILGAAIAWSTAGLGQHALEATAATQIAGRAFFAFMFLLGVVGFTERGRAIASLRSLGLSGVIVTVSLAISSGTFLFALNYTSVANVLFFQAAAPMLAALLAWVVMSERIAARTWLAIAVAAVGMSVMVAGSLDAGALAVLLPFVMTTSFAVVIVITRHRQEVSMLPATCASQVLVLVVLAPFISIGSATGSDWTIFLLLGFFQMGLGLTLLTVGARMLPSAEVALLTLLEVVLGPLWVWLAYSERPTATTLVGGAIITIAVIVQATASNDPAPMTAPVLAVPTPDSS